MKTTNTFFRKVALIFISSSYGFNLLHGAETPQPVRSLLEKRQEAIERINLVFIQELEKLKVSYTKSGDLENANLVVGLINEAKQTDSNNGELSDGLEPKTLFNEEEQVRQIRITGTFEVATFRIREDELDILSYGFAAPEKVTINGKNWQIEWPKGNTSAPYQGFDNSYKTLLKTLRKSEPNVIVEKGRGEVKIKQLPSRQNDFTLLVEVIDGPGGAGEYDFIISW